MPKKISVIRGVEAVKDRFWGYYFDPVGRANYTLMVPEGIDFKDDAGRVPTVITLTRKKRHLPWEDA